MFKFKILVDGLLNLTPIFSSLKEFIFSDGKFKLERSLVLVAVLVVLSVSVSYIGSDDLKTVVDQLDEVSDIIGYN